jgi:hypothetical protein
MSVKEIVKPSHARQLWSKMAFILLTVTELLYQSPQISACCAVNGSLYCLYVQQFLFQLVSQGSLLLKVGHISLITIEQTSLEGHLTVYTTNNLFCMAAIFGSVNFPSSLCFSFFSLILLGSCPRHCGLTKTKPNNLKTWTVEWNMRFLYSIFPALLFWKKKAILCNRSLIWT